MHVSSPFRFSPIALAIFSLYSTVSFAETQSNSEQDQAPSQTAKRMNITVTKGYTNLITDDKSRTETGTAITVLDEEYIENTQATTVAELLQAAPGISIVNNGGLGKRTSVFIRGASSDSTVVVIDGIRMDDKSNSSGGFDFGDLMADGIERIEIIRGSQSALWGSDALGGVINITTKTGSEGFHPNASLEYGSNNYTKQFVNVNGGNDKALYSLSFANLKTDGFDATSDPTKGPDDDGYKNQLINGKASYQFNRFFSLDGVARYTQSHNEYDTSYKPGMDNDVFGEGKQFTSKLNAHMNLLDDHWLNRLSVSYAKSNSESHDPQSSVSPYSEHEGESVKGELQSDYLLTTGDFNHRFTVVGEVEKTTYLPWSSTGGADEQKMNSSALVGEYGINWSEKIFLSGSLRHDFNSEFDDTNTYKLALSAWATSQIRLHSTYGTGAKNPTFSQLDSPAQSALDPETSKAWDAGIEYNFTAFNGYVDLTYFNAKYNDKISYIANSWPAQYENQDENSQGIEFSGFTKITQDLSLNGQYTYLETEDGTPKKNELLRRPKHSASLNTNYKFTPKLSSNLGINYVGKRLDYDSYPKTFYADAYTLVRLGGIYQFNDHFSMNARIENVLDKDYEAVKGYATDPLSGYIGVSFK